MKRKMALILAFLMIITMFAACGNGGEASTSAEASQAAPPPVASSAAAVSAAPTTDAGPNTNADGLIIPDEKYHLGFLLSDGADQMPSYCRKAAEALVAAQYSDIFEITVADANRDADRQNQQGIDLISLGCDALILYNFNFATCQPITQAANEADVPLVTVVKRLENQDDATAYCGHDDVTAGERSAEIAIDMLGGKEAKILVLQGKLGTDSASKRTQGYHNVLDNAEGVEIIKEETANWSRTEAMTVIENNFQSGLEFNVILCNNDEMAIGAGLALQGLGENLDDYIICGIDGTQVCCESIQEGVVDGTIYLNSTSAVGAALDILYKKLNNLPYEDYFFDVIKVTKDNAADIIQDWEDLAAME